jgi:hypothetical protein
MPPACCIHGDEPSSRPSGKRVDGCCRRLRPPRRDGGPAGRRPAEVLRGTVDHVAQTVDPAGTTREAVRTVTEPVVARVREIAPVAGGTVDRVVGGLLGGR